MTKKNVLAGLLLFAAMIAFIKRDFLVERISGLVVSRYNETPLIIATNTPETDITPDTLDLSTLMRTANVYEGLVRFDRSLKIVPALAVSWGNREPTVWEFKLRRGVLFQDRSPFDADSVVRSLEDVRASGGESKTALETIREIKVTDPYNLEIITKAPDPLLLSKLTRFFIRRPGNIGTGPYKIKERVKGETLTLTAFADYWGPAPRYRTAEYRVIASTEKRKNDFESGAIDLLAAVPPEQAVTLPADQIKSSYSLEVNFLMFKTDDPVLKDRKIRDAIARAFDPEKIRSIGNDFVRQASQFIAPGVFGYNDSIPFFKFDETARPRNLFGGRLEKLTLDTSDSFGTLSEYLAGQLREAGFSVKVNLLDPLALLTKIKNNQSQLFLIGWQSENGDAGGFLDTFIHSRGELNGGRLKNAEIDRLIESSRQEMNAEKRLKTLQDLQLKIKDTAIGLPLIETSRLYAVTKGLSWEPRLDGLVLAEDMR